MGLLKSVPVPETQVPIQAKAPTDISNATTWEDVPIDIFRHLSIDLGTIEKKEVGKIKDIYQWAVGKCDEPTMGNILNKWNTLENQLGSPAINEKRWDKAWRFVKIQRQIDDLHKRQEVLRRRWAI
jgi:hypothetical protein